MNRALTLLNAAVAGLLLLAACNPKAPATGDTPANPVFQSNPALKDLTNRISNSPRDASLYFSRGNLLHGLKMDSLALADYKKAASLDTNRAEYYSTVGDVLFEHRDINGSLYWIQKAIAKDPHDKKAHLKIAKLLLYTGQDYQRAISEVNEVLRSDVHNPEAYFLKAMVYKYSRDTAKALSTFLTALDQDPDYKDAIIQIALLYSAKKDTIALHYLDRAWRLDTTDVFPIFAKGVFYQDTKDYEKAKAEYRQCIIRNHKYIDAFFNMGYVLRLQDSVEKSYRQYDLVVKNDPMNPTGYFNRGLCSEMLDSVKRAIADYKMAEMLDSTYKSPREALKRLKVE